ncbi:MAG: serine hydrolase [Haliea sp.]|uniref:serine hydrolase domain-containing protein n=1 Tax=Haliea sp. TaxID=1932666 RepID=UPI0032ED241C
MGKTSNWPVRLLPRSLAIAMLLGCGPTLASSGLELNTIEVLGNQTRGFESDAVVVYCGEQESFSSGDASERYNIASIRKSLVSALYGVAIAKGLIDPDASLKSLEFDDPLHPLTEQEKRATLRDLLKSRSGIYLPALGESESMKRRKPPRGSKEPGSFFYYNNWDFNALGVIFERATEMRLGDAFKQWIATPVGMEDFRVDDVIYQEANQSAGLRMYRFYMSTRDLARFAALYANGGLWSGAQLVPIAWVNETLTAHSTVPYGIWDGYGMLWWYKRNSDTWWGLGSGGQRLVINRGRRQAVVLMNNTGQGTISRWIYRNFGSSAPDWEAFAIQDILAQETTCGGSNR